MRAGLLFSLVSAAFVAIGCSDDSSNSSGTTSEANANRSDATGCAAFCAHSVGCPKDPAPQCLSSCQTSARLCPGESAAVLACTQGKPDSAFHCDASVQVTTINEDVCSSETDTLLACVVKAAF
jgi:hypothetical protein